MKTFNEKVIVIILANMIFILVGIILKTIISIKHHEYIY